MRLSLGKAAQAAGASKATLLKALAEGELSGTKSAKGIWQIDPAEVARYREGRDQARQGRTVPIEPSAPEAKPVPDLAALQVELRMLRERLDEAIERERRAEERAEKALAEEREAKAAFTRLIADQRPRGLWARLTGR